MFRPSLTLLEDRILLASTLNANAAGGLLGDPGPDHGLNQLFVQRAYHDLFGRDANPDELAAWTGLLNGGTVSRAEAVLGLESTPEYRLETAAKIFTTVLGPAPDAAKAQEIAMESLLHDQDDYLGYTLNETNKTLDRRLKGSAAPKPK